MLAESHQTLTTTAENDINKISRLRPDLIHRILTVPTNIGKFLLSIHYIF